MVHIGSKVIEVFLDDDEPYVRHPRSCPVAEESIANNRAEHLSNSDRGVYQRALLAEALAH